MFLNFFFYKNMVGKSTKNATKMNKKNFKKKKYAIKINKLKKFKKISIFYNFSTSNYFPGDS